MSEIDDYLNNYSMTLATLGSDGKPHAAAVYFATSWGQTTLGDDSEKVLGRMRLYYLSDQESQHSQDIKNNGQAAVTIHSEVENWNEIRGLQMRGIIRLVHQGQEWETAWKYYQDKFPFVSRLKVIVARNTFYVFIPKWIRLIDNRQGFGFKKEWDLDDGT
jgi:uncharacterized protein YhbP (UPF0306 family)